MKSAPSTMGYLTLDRPGGYSPVWRLVGVQPRVVRDQEGTPQRLVDHLVLSDGEVGTTAYLEEVLSWAPLDEKLRSDWRKWPKERVLQWLLQEESHRLSLEEEE